MTELSKVKELRNRTGCAIVDCKEALQEAGDDIDQAITILRTKGKAHAAKKADRAVAEGIITSYVHSNNKIAVLVSLLCETDFVARSDRFQALAKDIALHVAATDPSAIKPEDISAEDIAKEKAVADEQAITSGKPAEIQAKMVEGKLIKFRTDRALLTQPFVKDPSKTVEDLVNEAISELGENITIGQFHRLSI